MNNIYPPFIGASYGANLLTQDTATMAHAAQEQEGTVWLNQDAMEKAVHVQKDGYEPIYDE